MDDAAPTAEHFLDLDNWPRRETFEFFRRFDKPYFNVCTRLDLTALVQRHRGDPAVPLSLAYHHLALEVANEVEPFRYRLHGHRVRVHPHVHASMAVLRDDGSIAFARLPWHAKLADFVADARPRVDAVRRATARFDPLLDDASQMHFTTLPWLDFTSFSHARNWGREDSIPKIAFGRLVDEGGRWRMAMSVEVHHALMDGLHVGQFVQGLERRLGAANAGPTAAP